jgi:D-glycero-D-manno-heptose 1,7-bisphosphate phosphatase
VKSRNWAVFLDRDGTLVRNAHHPVRPDQLVPYAGVGEALRRLRRAGARLAVVSNQSAVARGLLDEAGLARMDRHLRALLRAEGVRLDRTDYCPHHPDFTGPCRCRKPAPGMIRAGLRALGVSARRSWMVGDTADDLAAGRTSGLRTVLVLTGHGRRDRTRVLREGLADHVTRDLAGAARRILEARAD